MTETFRYSFPLALKAAFWGALMVMLASGFTSLIGGAEARQLFSWQSVQLFCLLLVSTLLFVYSHLFNETIEVSETAIRIQRRVGKATELPFDEIRRLILRQHQNKHSGEEWILHLYRSDVKRAATIYVTDLVVAADFEALLSKQAKTYNIPLIRQDEEGNLL